MLAFHRISRMDSHTRFHFAAATPDPAEPPTYTVKAFKIPLRVATRARMLKAAAWPGGLLVRHSVRESTPTQALGDRGTPGARLAVNRAHRVPNRRDSLARQRRLRHPEMDGTVRSLTS